VGGRLDGKRVIEIIVPVTIAGLEHSQLTGSQGRLRRRPAPGPVAHTQYLVGGRFFGRFQVLIAERRQLHWPGSGRLLGFRGNHGGSLDVPALFTLQGRRVGQWRLFGLLKRLFQKRLAGLGIVFALQIHIRCQGLIRDDNLL